MQASPPLSRQYYQAARSALELQEDSLPVSLGSYRRPGRTDNGTNILPTMKSFLRTPSRRVFLTSSIVVVLVVVTVAVVLAVTLSRQTPSHSTSLSESNLVALLRSKAESKRNGFLHGKHCCSCPVRAVPIESQVTIGEKLQTRILLLSK